MNSVKRHIIKWLCLSVLPWVFFVSCSKDSDFTYNGISGGAASGQPVSLRIVVGNDVATRSLPETNVPTTDEEETGTIDENHIDIEGGDYCILFFDKDNKFLSKFEPGDVTLIPTVTDERVYFVLGSLASSLPPIFKVVVLANWSNYPNTIVGKTTIEDVCSQIYDYTMDFVPSAYSGKGIPMYGVKTCSGISFTPNLLHDLGTIDMLRAMAKVEIVCEDENIKITSAEFNCINPQGFCAPSGMYDNTENVSSVHIPNISAGTGNKTKTYENGVNKAVFYIPEYDNKSKDAAIKLTFKLSENDSRDGKIYFKDYTENTFFDIARNYVYRFTVRLKTKIEILYTVCPWQNYTIDVPSFE